MDAADVEQWNGEGLPPAGHEVEVLHNERWIRASAVGRFGDGCMVCAPNGGGFYGFYAEEIRPIRSEEYRAVERMMEELGKASGACATASICRALYRAGYRKTEDDA